MSIFNPANTAEKAESFTSKSLCSYRLAAFESCLVEFGAELKRVSFRPDLEHCIIFKDGSLIMFKGSKHDWYTQTQECLA